MRTILIAASLLVLLSSRGWAAEDCGNRLAWEPNFDQAHQECRIANALETIAEKLK